ncbi:MAG: aminopeptidase P family protein [Muribaculaceae bacterium]|nr:aminopeptidase P family protein [Muribaculaceae bacterium]
MSEVNERIAALRDKMRGAGVAATVIPQTDPHQSEYLADHWQLRRWLSGFTGSAGALVVTLDKAYVWADSRYWLQAAAQLEGTCIEVMEEGKPEVPEITEYLCEHLQKGDTVGIDGMVFSIDATRAMMAALSNKGIGLKVDFSPVDELWADRPAIPEDKIFVHDIKYAGEDARTKLRKILDEAEAAGANAAFISDLAEVAWALNIRSRDVESNPVVTAFLYVAPEGSTLFVDAAKLTPEVNAYLADNGVATLPYGEAMKYLGALAEQTRVLVSTAQSAGALEHVLGARMVGGKSPVALLKGVKNDVQVAGVRAAMVRDGVALVKAVMEIERTLEQGGELTEMDVADILTKYRSAQALYFDQSFDTIAGYGPHGAIVHYSANKETNARIYPEGLLLIDSGANYLDGTTDITRTISLGNPTNAQRHDFTLVMKGHISLGTAIFPRGTRGAQLDVLARINLWKEGLSYLHGTGHGVGHFLNVHEGPQNIRLNENPTALVPGMITSNEPGLYREGEYGIRCENLVLTVPAFTTDFGEFYRFETLTLFPFDLTLFDTAIMTDEEIDWLNSYHAMVRERLLPHLEPKEQEWLLAKTVELKRCDC